MTALDDLANFYRELITEAKAEIAAMEAGRYRIFDGPGTANDITSVWIERRKGHVAQLESIIARHESGQGSTSK